MPNSLKSLLPCPWCGGEPEIVGETSTKIRCTNDQCISRHDIGGYNFHGHRYVAITAWNTRAPAAKEGELPTDYVVARLSALWTLLNDAGDKYGACDTIHAAIESLSRQGGEPAYDRELIANMLEDSAGHIETWPPVAMRAQAELLRAADNRDAAGVRTGRASEAGDWVLVPRVPTSEMLDAGMDELDGTMDIWAAMLAAAPAPGG